jgi:hypothetical protein
MAGSGELTAIVSSRTGILEEASHRLADTIDLFST